jgi:hypothetical protein
MHILHSQCALIWRNMTGTVLKETEEAPELEVVEKRKMLPTF